MQTLRDAGLLIVEEGTKDVLARVQARPTPMPWPQLPNGDPSPFGPGPPIAWPTLAKAKTLKVKPVDGIQFPSDSQAFEEQKEFRSGWIVPVGQKELIELKFVEWRSGTAFATFTWKWIPSEVGRHFDSSGDPPEFVSGQSTGQYTRPKTAPKLNSSFLFKGTAELTQTSQGWEVKTINWLDSALIDHQDLTSAEPKHQ